MKIIPLFTPLVLLACPLLARDQDTPSVPSADEVVARMGARDAQRQLATEGYAGMRKYTLENEGLQKHAEMIVRVNGDPDGTKHFEIVSEDGWKAAHKHVLRKMLDSEAETSRPGERAKSRLNAENYDFQLVGVEAVGDRPAYDKRYGRERQGDELPEELQRRETRIARIQEAKKALEERAREKAESENKDGQEAKPESKAHTILRIRSPANDKQQVVPLIEAIEEQSRTETERSFGGQWVLLGGKSEVPGEEKDGRVHRDGKTETR